MQSKKIALVGAPNVGKSLIFNCLTGKYAMVSNYPGTTVDVRRGRLLLTAENWEVTDTPGMYSLVPLSEEERVARDILLKEKFDLIIHVIDAKNIGRMLPMTLMLLAAGLPVILVLNVMDEAEALGLRFELELLSQLLGIPVIPTVAAKKRGINEIKKTIAAYRKKNTYSMGYHEAIEACITKINDCLQYKYNGNYLTSLLLMAGDKAVHARIRQDAKSYQHICKIIEETAQCFDQKLYYIIAAEFKKAADQITTAVVKRTSSRKASRGALMLDKLTRQPLTGVPILLLVIYFGLYEFVGKLGAGVLVDYLDKHIFTEIVIPLLKGFIETKLPWEWLTTLLIGDYGIITLGLRYAVAIILPVISIFFLLFAVLEDCGYLPRLAMLLNNIFSLIGLNGRAAIPFTLGFGCGTMATMVARTLETRRERLIAIFLLALGIPCSAQLGLVLALLAATPDTLLLWCSAVTTVCITSGVFAARIMPGKATYFYMELPVMRVPVLQNVVVKAYTRVLMYFQEILPIFILVSFFMWLADRTGVLAELILAVRPLTAGLGLPPEFGKVFILGFFRRDYGAAGLYDMFNGSLLTEHQLLVAAVFLTLFVPCVAQCAVMIKECGLIPAVFMVIVIMLIAYTASLAVNFAF